MGAERVTLHSGETGLHLVFHLFSAKKVAKKCLTLYASALAVWLTSFKRSRKITEKKGEKEMNILSSAFHMGCQTPLRMNWPHSTACR